MQISLSINDKNEAIQCDLISLPKVGNQIDRYYVEVDMSNVTNDNVVFSMVLDFRNSYDYLEKKSTLVPDHVLLNVNRIRRNDVEYDSYSNIIPAIFQKYNYLELNYYIGEKKVKMPKTRSSDILFRSFLSRFNFIKTPY